MKKDRKVTNKIIQKWIKLDEKGLTRIQIGEKTGYNPHTIGYHLIKNNKRKHFSIEEKSELICKEYEKRKSIIQISKDYKFSVSGIFHLLKRNGIIDKNKEKEIEEFKKHLLKLNEFEKGYICALIDGEGYIGIIKHKDYHTQLAIGNCNKAIIDYFQKLLPQFLLYEDNKKKKNWNKCYKLILYKQNLLLILLEFIKNGLIGKKEQAKLLIKFIKNPKDRNELCNKIKKLNQRGIKNE